MNLASAMSNLGLDSRSYLLTLSKSARPARIAAARIMMVEAKKAARTLMANHHPDKGGSHETFVKINASLDYLVRETETFINAMEKRVQEDAEKLSKTPRIVLGGG
jgi:hypothetical protein